MQVTTRKVDDNPYGRGMWIAREKKAFDRLNFQKIYRAMPEYNMLRFQHSKRVAAMRIKVLEMRAARELRQREASSTRLQTWARGFSAKLRVAKLKRALAAKAAYRLKHNDYFVTLARSKAMGFPMPPVSSFLSFK